MPTFQDVREISLGLPEVEEHVTWGSDVNFRIRNKMFAIGGDEADHVSIKSNLTTQADLIDLGPETFASAAYVGRFGWVTVDLARVDADLLSTLLTEAWRRTAPKRLATTLEEI